MCNGPMEAISIPHRDLFSWSLMGIRAGGPGNGPDLINGWAHGYVLWKIDGETEWDRGPEVR